MYFNGLELLELRLETLYDTVDYFVINEAGQTHTGAKRDFEFDINRFEKYKDKIRYIKLETLPYTDGHQNEYYQRNRLIDGCYDAQPDDYIMISDDDEIINPETLKEGIRNNHDLFRLSMKLFYYYVNNLRNQLWGETIVGKRKHFGNPQDMRMKYNGVPIINNGGWHYSYLGGLDKIQLKFNSFSEQQTNTPEINNRENILKCLETGEDVCHRQGDIFKNRFISLEEVGHPQLKEWLTKYPEYIKII